MSNKKNKEMAQQFYQLEKICQDPSTSQLDKDKAELAMAELTNKIMSRPDGINVLLKIDTILQDMM